MELSLLTDLYQLTMAYGYWKAGVADREAAFHLYFRKNPFGGGYTVAAGLEQAVEFIESFAYSESDIAYLRTLGHFEDAFLDYLRSLKLTCTIDAVPEGTVVFPQEPLIRVQGPIIEGQLLETPLLNMINFSSLIATKASRIARAARGEPVLEFGLRRAQGINGGLTASRAAYVGGCAATSNVLAGKKFGIPVQGTHAHSWVMLFEDELASFETYADAMPDNCVFLVDTYDTIEGVRNAVKVGRRLRERGHEMIGIRLDSGDLAYLSIEARKILDQAGFPEATIVASNDLDEHIIESLKEQGARINVWGVGTKLATAFDQPALGGVYKLSAVRNLGGEWDDRIKLSEQAIKINNPGILQVRRFANLADVIYDEREPPTSWTLVDPLDMTRRKSIEPALDDTGIDLLVPVFENGKRVFEAPALDAIRDRVQAQLAGFHDGIKRFVHPHRYPVGLEETLYDRKTQLILQARGDA